MARVVGSGTAVPMNIGSSPPSGSDRTHYNTPSTNITVVSPIGQGNGPAPKLNLRDIDLSKSSASLPGQLPKYMQQCLVPPPAAEAPSLSPTAAEFTPSVRGAVHIPPQGTAGPSGMHYGQVVANTTPFGVIGQAIPSRAIVSDAFKDQLVHLGPNVALAIGQFSNEENTARVFEIAGVANPEALTVAANFPVRDFKSLVQIDSSEMHKGTFRMVFSNIRDARQAFIRAAYTAYPRCKLTFLSPKTVAATRGHNPARVSDFAAQLLVTVAHGHPGFDIFTVADFFNILSQAGEVYAVHSAGPAGDGLLNFRVEYCDVRDAEAALDLFNNGDFLIRLRAIPYSPDLKHGTGMVSLGYQERLSLTGRSTMPTDNLQEAEALMARLMVSESPMSRHFGRSGHNQVDVVRIQEGVDVRTTIMLRNIPNKVTQADLKHFLDETSYGAYDFMYLRIDFANNCNVGYAFINFIDPLAIVPFAQARAGVKWNIHDSNKVAEISYATIQGRDCLVQKFRNSSVMLEHPSFRPKLYFAGNHPMAGQEERFPDPDNFSKMRRSIENAEHIGLFRPSLGGHKLALAPAKFDHGTPSPNRPAFMPSDSTFTAPVVDIDHPNDPFAGTPGRPALTLATHTPASTPDSIGLFAPREGQQHREEQRRRRSQFDRGTPGAKHEANAHRLYDAALDRSGHGFAYPTQVAQAPREHFI